MNILRRYSVDFVLTEEEEKQMKPSKYIGINDSNENIISEGELYFIGYENENGDECDEDGEEL